MPTNQGLICKNKKIAEIDRANNNKRHSVEPGIDFHKLSKLHKLKEDALYLTHRRALFQISVQMILHIYSKQSDRLAPQTLVPIRCDSGNRVHELRTLQRYVNRKFFHHRLEEAKGKHLIISIPRSPCFSRTLVER